MKANVRGLTALVTGASGGIGEAIARELGSRGANLVLVARREEQLRRIADDISRTCKVRADIIAKDLQAEDAPDTIASRLKKSGTSIDILVNNAGFGLFGHFIDTKWERERDMINLNISALVHLTKLFAKEMVSRRSGYIMHIASIGAFQPTPYYSVYSATKAFVLSFGEALNHELHGTGVSSTVVSPGVTKSDFLAVAGQELNRFHKMSMMPAEELARIAVKAMLARKSSIVAGRINAFMAWSNRLIPRGLSAAFAGIMMK